MVVTALLHGKALLAGPVPQPHLACENLLTHYALTVKGNQPGLFAALRGLCWAGAARHVTTDKGHGRRERRSCLVMDAPEEIKALFPHVRQIAKVTRTRTVTG